ncbi:hypothetical protein [uncultured Anaerococcus sp.]|uniref:hypothetical protein n=1 Tax=uncultured Anaerococcus sp. TaxID=293428 RepID=UPI00288B4B50|nr:hypothetical protein [uncultured Anaerococcus sp.]
MNKLKKLLLIVIPIMLLTGCLVFKDKKSENIDKIEKEVIEVKKKPIENNIDVKSATFSSDIILDKIKEFSDNSYEITRINNLSQVESLDFDIAIVPAYQVVDLYNKTNGNIKLAAITLVNNLHIISDTQINNPKDMAGKTIMVPELNESIDKLIDSKLGFAKALMRISTESYYNQKELVKNLEKTENVIAILSEPYYSKVIGKKSYYTFDLNKAMSMIPNNKSDSDSDFLSDVIIVNKNFLKDNKECFDKFLLEYKKTQQSIDENTVLSQGIINNYDITNEEAIKIYKSMENTFIDSDTMSGVFEIYMDKLEKLDKNVFNGERPSDDLYYKN